MEEAVLDPEVVIEVLANQIKQQAVLIAKYEAMLRAYQNSTGNGAKDSDPEG